MHTCSKMMKRNKEIFNKKGRIVAVPIGEGRECNQKGNHEASRLLQLSYCLDWGLGTQ